MNILPFERRVFISPFSADELLHFLACTTKERKDYSIIPDKINNLHRFYGRIYEEKKTFVVTKKLIHTHTFLPIIYGKIETTHEGSVLLLEYKLLPATLFFLFFNIIASLLISCLFFSTSNYQGGWIALSFAALSYIITTFNFHLQVKDSHKLVEETFNL